MAEATCPKCGHRFTAGATKGEGAIAGSKMTHLTDSARETLGFLAYLEAFDLKSAVTSEMLENTINEDRAARKTPAGEPAPLPPRRSNSIGGDLSRAKGAGLVDSERNEVEMKDPSTQEVRHYRAPVWWLLPAGRRSLETGRIEQPAYDGQVGKPLPKESA